jgi:hypothetical protein
MAVIRGVLVSEQMFSTTLVTNLPGYPTDPPYEQGDRPRIIKTGTGAAHVAQYIPCTLCGTSFWSGYININRCAPCNDTFRLIQGG